MPPSGALLSFWNYAGRRCRGGGSGHRVQRPVVYKDPDESNLRSHTLPRWVGRRLEATVRLVHQHGEVREITREAGQSESSSLLSTSRGRKFTRKAIHHVKRGRAAKIAVCTRHFCTQTLSANKEGLGRCPNQSYRGNQLISKGQLHIK